MNRVTRTNGLLIELVNLQKKDDLTHHKLAKLYIWHTFHHRGDPSQQNTQKIVNKITLSLPKKKSCRG